MENKDNHKLLEHEIRIKRLEELLGLNVELQPPKRETPSDKPKKQGREEIFKRGFIKREHEEKEKALLNASDHLHALIGTAQYDVIMNRVQEAKDQNKIKTSLIKFLNGTIYKELEKAKTTQAKEKKDSNKSPLISLF